MLRTCSPASSSTIQTPELHKLGKTEKERKNRENPNHDKKKKTRTESFSEFSFSELGSELISFQGSIADLKVCCHLTQLLPAIDLCSTKNVICAAGIETRTMKLLSRCSLQMIFPWRNTTESVEEEGKGRLEAEEDKHHR